MPRPYSLVIAIFLNVSSRATHDVTEEYTLGDGVRHAHVMRLVSVHPVSRKT